MSIRQGTSTEIGGHEVVYVKVLLLPRASGSMAWRVTFLSHLEVSRRQAADATPPLFRDIGECIDRHHSKKIGIAVHNAGVKVTKT